MYVDSTWVVNDKIRNTFYEYMANLGVKQGDGASPILFILFFDKLYPYLLTYFEAEGTCRAKRTAYTIASLQLFMLLYADDIVLLAPSP